MNNNYKILLKCDAEYKFLFKCLHLSHFNKKTVQTVPLQHTLSILCFSYQSQIENDDILKKYFNIYVIIYTILNHKFWCKSINKDWQFDVSFVHYLFDLKTKCEIRKKLNELSEFPKILLEIKKKYPAFMSQDRLNFELNCINFLLKKFYTPSDIEKQFARSQLSSNVLDFIIFPYLDQDVKYYFHSSRWATFSSFSFEYMERLHQSNLKNLRIQYDADIELSTLFHSDDWLSNQCSL